MTAAVPIAAVDTHPLRQRVLRPHQSLAEMDYAGDNDQASAHFGCFVDGILVSVGSLYRESRAGIPLEGWRIRGMATIPDQRDRGLGSGVLDACVAYARDHGAG